MGKTIHLFGFPSDVSAESVKVFLERHTGGGTVYALKVRQAKNKRGRSSSCESAYAIVQFTTVKDAELIMSLAKQQLYYENSYLKAKEMKADSVKNPINFVHRMEHIKLHFGCPISNEMSQFHVLWEAMDVSVNFGLEMEKLFFHLSHLHVEYKLVVFYDDIWKIQLNRPYDQAVKFLLIQLRRAPRIFEKRKAETVFEDPVFNCFMEPPDEQWIRATDFTPSSCIGQSSTLCLELPYAYQLPNFKENFSKYKENEGQFLLKSGSTFSNNSYLVPIISPPQGVDLPYDILFKINSLVHRGCLSGPTLDVKFFRLLDPSKRNTAHIEHVLDKLYSFKKCCYKPLNWLHEQYRNYHTSMRPLKSPTSSFDSGLVYVRRVQITPCKVYFYGPEPNVSNCVLRNYSDDIDNFLRVSFVDEDFDQMHSADLSLHTGSPNVNKRTGIYERILSVLRDGIVIGNRKFEFLAFSSSQVRESSVWMFSSRPDLTAADIREWTGYFREIRNVAKYAARLGQSFSSSTETFNVGKHEIEIIPDVEVEREGTKYVFSDGIGKISAELAQKVGIKCNLKGYTPSAFQIRYGGYKGVVAVDPKSSMKLSLRKSMSKYESQITKLDVVTWSKFHPGVLNRQVIILLSTLGVSDHVFQKKQKEFIDQMNVILTDQGRANETLELMSPGGDQSTHILKEMLMCGYKPDDEPFLSMMLHVYRASKLLELKGKTRIFIPNGRAMMGCMDETGTLKYGQVFVQFSGTGQRKFNYYSLMFCDNESNEHIVEGEVVVAKNPCLHPGDIRVLRAVDVPDLHHMVDCIVFPQQGKRPHPDECSGSDLDGDIYFVCWDPELIPPRRKIQPSDYTPAPTKDLDHDVTLEEVKEYFANYIIDDSLGIITNAHTVFADKEKDKAMSNSCLELARLFSIAVDFPKTGVPAKMPSHLHPREYPDFMEKPNKPTYESQNIIGKLFREVKDIAVPHTFSINSFTSEMAMRSYDLDMEVDGFEDYIDDAFYYKSTYDYKLGKLMDYYRIKSEAEILSGITVKRSSKSFDRRKDTDAIVASINSLKREARAWFFHAKRSGVDHVSAKASAWYHVTYHPSYWGCYNEGTEHDHFLSFPWCVSDKLMQIKRDKMGLKLLIEGL